MCHVCGQSHEGDPMSFAADFPDMYANMKEEERKTRAVISSDQCIIDGEWFFLRGCIEIPILESRDVFVWGLWAVVKQEDFDEIDGCWEELGREARHGPFNGRLANSVSAYPEALNVKLRVLLQQVGTRPLFIEEEGENPIGLAQRSGISKRQAAELVSVLLHGPPN
jgi:hypothetical protein